MKNLTKPGFRLHFLLFVTSILLCSLFFNQTASAYSLIFVDENSHFAPDSIPPDSTSLADTIAVTAIYVITDTANLYTDGLDSVILLQEDTTIYFVQADSVSMYYIGDADTAVHFTKPVDTVAYYFATDTIAYFIPKYDTVAYKLIPVASSDSTENGYNNYEKIQLLLGLTVNSMHVTLSANVYDINENLFGIHIPGIFSPDHISENDLNYLQAWHALRDLKPTSLRFPGGADTRWMHPVPYDKDWDGDKDPVKGYGFDIYEIIRFFDVTDDNPDADDDIESDEAFFVDAILVDMNDPLDVPGETLDKPVYSCNDCETWMNDEYQDEFESLYKKWIDQEALPATIRPYIDQFISLVDMIENYWHATSDDGHLVDLDYKIDVIIDLSIPKMSATECRDEVEYLRNGAPVVEGGNGITSVNVTGVEMGNEVFYGWGIDMMGFETFADYWNYIDGNDPDADWTSKYYDYVYGDLNNPDFPVGDYTTAQLEDKTYLDHNYLEEMKLNITPAPKVGIPVIVQSDDDPFGLTVPAGGGTCPTCKIADDWETVGDYYTIKFPHTNIFKFDAVILHPYYPPTNDNWGGIPLHYLCTSYPSSGPPSCINETCADFDLDKWQDDEYDSRLKTAFDAMIGYPALDYCTGTEIPQTGNINDFLKNRFVANYIHMNEVLHFDMTSAAKKELWETEKNLKNHNNAEKYVNPNCEEEITLSPYLKNLWKIYDNTFVQGYLIMEWFLKDIKLNFNPNFRPGFFTYAHFHSLGAGGWEKLLVETDCGDDDYLSTIGVSTGGEPYYLKRTTYWTYYLLSIISKEHLQYLKSTTSKTAKKNINQPPTLFITPDKQYVVGFYSNANESTENITIDPISLMGLFPGATQVTLGNPIIKMVNAEYPYSGSGKNVLYTPASASIPRINICYGCETGGDPGEFHPYEIRGITEAVNVPECTDLPPGQLCVSVDGYSYGYFQCPVNISYTPLEERLSYYPKAEMILYPNPAGQYCTISVNGADLSDELIDISIADISGVLKANYRIKNNERVDISGLPAGLYIITTRLPNNQHLTTQLIKLN